MNVGFLCNSMCFLRYYVPIIRALNSYSDVNSTIFIARRDKYDEPVRHLKALDELGQKHGFITRGVKEIPKTKQDIFITIEGELVDFAHAPVYSMTYQTDFRISYPKYKDKISKIFMPSKFLANYYGINPPNARFYQPTKYTFLEDNICKKYGIDPEKEEFFALVILPRLRDANINLLNSIVEKLEDRDYSVLLKTRGKDPFPCFEGKRLFSDFSWSPHTTLELLRISEFAINFDSTAIEECLFEDVPVINFPCKTHRERGLDFLYSEASFCMDKEDRILVDSDISWAEETSRDYSDIKEKYFHAEHGNVHDMVRNILSV